MNGIIVKPSENWKSAFGLCAVCGMPLGLMPREDISIDDVEENSVRVALFRFNMLGKMEQCHIIDKYTSLPKEIAEFTRAITRHAAEFEELLEAKRMLKDLSENENAEYDKGVDTCMRLVDRPTVPGCRDCNKEMTKPEAHADVVYRCFPRTATAVSKVLENRSKVGKAVSTANDIKKTIQQIALFFRPPESPTERWRVKADQDVILDAALYRCVCALAVWGKTGNARQRMVAMFYAAWYIYHSHGGSMGEVVATFLDWHIHVFRIFYMATVPATTWFGMEQGEAAVRFDTTLKQGERWLQEIRDVLDANREKIVEYMASSVKLGNIRYLKDMLLESVHDERSLMQFACKKDVKVGVNAILQFYLYNTSDSRCRLLNVRAQGFVAWAVKELRHEQQNGKTTGATTSRRRVGGSDDVKRLVRDVARISLVEDASSAASLATSSAVVVD